MRAGADVARARWGQAVAPETIVGIFRPHQPELRKRTSFFGRNDHNIRPCFSALLTRKSVSFRALPGVEFFKIKSAESLGPQAAWDNRNTIYLGASACAEFIADIFLCPLEATRIRQVSNPDFAPGTIAAMSKMASEEGVINAFYSGFGPILLKQVPYTMAKFAVQGIAAEKIYESIGSSPSQMSSAGNVTVSLGSGVIAGVCAAIISHPADTLLSKVNKAGAGGSGSIASRLYNIAAETGMYKLCTQGLGARCVMIGTLTAGQFGIFDSVMNALGASKFHFHPPGDH